MTKFVLPKFNMLHNLYFNRRKFHYTYLVRRKMSWHFVFASEIWPRICSSALLWNSWINVTFSSYLLRRARKLKSWNISNIFKFGEKNFQLECFNLRTWVFFPNRNFNYHRTKRTIFNKYFVKIIFTFNTDYRFMLLEDSILGVCNKACSV